MSCIVECLSRDTPGQAAAGKKRLLFITVIYYSSRCSKPRLIRLAQPRASFCRAAAARAAPAQGVTGYSEAPRAASPPTLAAPTSSFPLAMQGPSPAATPVLYAVACASRSLCFAAGGFAASGALAASWPAPSAFGPDAAAEPAASASFGQVLRSVNGGTFWTVRAAGAPVPVPGSLPPPPRSSLAAAQFSYFNPGTNEETVARYVRLRFDLGFRVKGLGFMV